MAATALLAVGDLLQCPHCHGWHRVIRSHDEGTDYTQQMAYFSCKGLRYYAGQIGYASRHETRPPSRAVPR